MRFFRVVSVLPALMACLCAQDAKPQAEAPVPGSEMRGLPPRAAPADYEAHGVAGNVSVAAEFLGHSIPRPEGEPLTTDEYIVVETALFGPPNSHLQVTLDNFSLRVNEKKKTPLIAQPFGLVFHSLKEPEWQAEADLEMKKKKDDQAGINRNPGAEPPRPPKMPIELQRAIQAHVRKVALPEGDRPLPDAGLLFFRYLGKVETIHSMELTYAGPAGSVTLTLQ